MEPTDREITGEGGGQYTPGNPRFAPTYPELCSEFLTTLAKAIKNTALYTLSHPMVLEALRKNCALLGALFDAKKEASITLTFVNDSWLFNDTPVPAVTQESQNLNAFFKAHRLQGLTFTDGIQPFEMGALCEVLAAQARNRPPGFMEEFFAGKGVNNIRPETVHYIKEGGYTQASGGAPAAAPAPRPAPGSGAARPVQEIFPEYQAAPPTARPPQAAPQVRQLPPVQARPPQAAPPVQQSPLAARPPQTAPQAQQPRPAVQAKPPQAVPPARQQPPAAAKPPQEAKPAPAPLKKTDLDAMFGPGPGTGAPKPAESKPVGKPAPDSLFGPGPGGAAPGGGKAGEGPGGGKAGEGTGGGKSAEGPGGGKAAEGPGGGAPRESPLGNMSFGGILKGLVESAVKDPKDRIRAYEDALKTLKDTMEQQIAESTRALAAEKEAALNTRARTEHVLSRVADGKVIVDKDGNILMMNPAAEEIAGTKLSDAVGRHITEQLRPGEHILTLSRDMDLSNGNVVSGEVDIKGDENMGRAMRRSVAMLVDADGRVVGELSTMPEITKYKEAQRMQEEFLSRVTHDLQSPLSSISSALEMLTEAAAKKLDPMESKFLDISIRNSQRLSQMIRGILDFSKLQSGKMELRPVPAFLGSILAEAVEGLMPWAKTKGINLELRPVPEGLGVLADAPRIVQVVTNLISNAIKATHEGGSVVVAAAPSPERDGNALIGVRDTGHGIPKEDLNKLFRKFVQLESRQSQEGVGLGLAIVYDFLKLHNGRIWADSELGKGSTFYFTLPLAEVKPEL
ncbi:MAG: PAS domain S-box protein [Elusimicrobia bacterium]|nr:PAS domain S-box protein [Elusimicrobiota bacterium]